MDEELTVEYTVKELLNQLQRSQDVGFTEVKASLSNKADKVDVERLNRRLDEHGREIGWLKDRQREDEAVTAALTSSRKRSSEYKWKLVTFAAGIPLAIAAALQIAHVIPSP